MVTSSDLAHLCVADGIGSFPVTLVQSHGVAYKIQLTKIRVKTITLWMLWNCWLELQLPAIFSTASLTHMYTLTHSQEQYNFSSQIHITHS